MEKTKKIAWGEQAVWFKVMSIIYRAGNSSVRIPSSNELAAEFGIAASTVRLTFKKLEKAGYVFSKKGSGTFTRPSVSFFYDSNGIPLIGLLILSGDLFFYPSRMIPTINNFLSEANHRGWNLRLIQERCTTPEETGKALQHAYLDGLVCISVREGVAEAAGKIVPTVNIFHKAEDLCSIYFKYDRIFETLCRENSFSGEKIFVLAVSILPDNNPLFHFLSRKKGVLFQKLSVIEDDEELFRKMLPEKHPDMIFIQGIYFQKIRDILEDFYGMEKFRKIIWVFCWMPCSDPAFKGYLIRSDEPAMFRTAADNLEILMKDPTAKVPSKSFEPFLYRLPENKPVSFE